jgi:hypothetical protein
VFFVISGYLISSIILSDLDRGSFSFADFYFRRIRRIMPILLSIIAATIPLAWVFLLPKAMNDYSSSALSALLFSSNFWFWLEDSYWAEPSALKPLLHTWSLSLEEQFYILFPAFIVLVTRFANKHSLAIIILVGIASLAAAEIFSSIMAVVTFYAIEKPARRSAKHRTVFSAIVVGTVGLLAIQVTIVVNQGFPSRMPPILAEDFDQEPWKNMKNSEGQYCFADYGKSEFCQFGVGNPRGEIVLLGDSTLEAISASLVPLLVEQGYSVVTMNGSGCYYLPGFDLVGPGDVNQRAGIDKCDPAFQDRRRKRIEQSPHSIVILGGIFHRYLDGSLKEFVDPTEPDLSVRDGYLRAVNGLLDAGHTVIQLAPFPFFEKNPASQLRTALAGQGNISPTSAGEIKRLSLNSGTMDSAAFQASLADATALFSSVKSPNMQVLFPHEIFCDSYLPGKCVSNDGEHLFFVDAAHPARAGADLIAAFIQRAVLDVAPQQ